MTRLKVAPLDRSEKDPPFPSEVRGSLGAAHKSWDVREYLLPAVSRDIDVFSVPRKPALPVRQVRSGVNGHGAALAGDGSTSHRWADGKKQ
jgi:hypothetical protein